MGQNVRDGTSPTPLIRRLLSVCRDLLRISQNLETPRVRLDSIDRSVELRCPAIRREHVRPKEVSNSTLIPKVSFQLLFHQVYFSELVPYREHHTRDNHPKVEALLGRPRGLLPSRKLIPRYMSIVVKRRDRSSPRARRGGSSEAVVLRCV